MAADTGQSLDEDADWVIQCAYLVSVGDAHLAEEEASHLSLVRGRVRRMLQARTAIENVEGSGSFEDAREHFDPCTPVELSVEGVLGLPLCLSTLHKERSAVRTQEALAELEREVARRSGDSFLCKVAFFFSVEVASADGDFSDGEQQTLGLMAQEWGLTDEDVISWYDAVAHPVLTGEEPTPGDGAAGAAAAALIQNLIDGLETGERTEAETAAELRRILGLDEGSSDER